jgi:hypothetical protein
MVMVRLPMVALLLAVTVIVEVPEPGAAMELGLNDTVSPLPSPDAEKLMAELKPPETTVLTAEVPEPLRATVIEVGDADRVKAGVEVEVTVSDTVAFCVTPPPVPVTVIE